MDNKISINIIAAIDQNSGLAKFNSVTNRLEIPWKIKEDMVFFKKMTLNCIVIMGKNTYLSLPTLNRGLSNRVNIVVSTSLTKQDIESTNVTKSNVILVKSLNQAILSAIPQNKPIYIIGGSNLYTEALKTLNIDQIYLSLISYDYCCNYQSDSFFPLSLIKLVPPPRLTKLLEEEVIDKKNSKRVKIIIYEVL